MIQGMLHTDTHRTCPTSSLKMAFEAAKKKKKLHLISVIVKMLKNTDFLVNNTLQYI